MIKPTLWQPADGLKLEPNALFAAHENLSNVAVTAGPGAGKTEMLAQRADFLLSTGLCSYPQRILAISFKADACRNLKERVWQRCEPRLAARLDSLTFHAFAKRLIDRFRPVLTGDHALDAGYEVGEETDLPSQLGFKDFFPLATQILRSSAVARNAVRQTYSHVFLDEFQDCTDTQYELVREAFRGTNVRLTAVGDVKQKIMGWADALDGVFDDFEMDFEAQHVNLYQNFRSLPRLRRMQNAMVRVMDPQAAVANDDIQGSAGHIEVLAFDNSQSEATRIVDIIHHQINVSGVPASQIAVLIPKQPDLYGENLMEVLSARGVPYRNEQDLQELSAEPVARLIVDFLSILVGDQQPDAYARVVATVANAGLGDEATYLLNARWHRLLDSAREDIRHGANRLRPFIEQFLDLLGAEVLTGLSADYEQGTYLADKISATYVQVSMLLKTEDDPATALSRFHEDHAVRILTVHKSKGLEFETVFILGVENETFWGKLPDERASFFVGSSRAKKALYLTSSAYRARPKAPVKYWQTRRTAQREFLGYASSTV
jgi:superfamily I DNA/RNA helicase